MKARYEDELARNTVEKSDLNFSNSAFQDYMEFGCSLVENLDEIYHRSDVHVKQEIVGSIFPENLTYSENGYRTTKVNEAILILSPYRNGFVQKKKGQTNDFVDLSYSVAGTGLEPVTFGL